MSVENIESNLEFCVNAISNLNKKYEKLFNQQIVLIIDSLNNLKKDNNKHTIEFKNALQRIYHQILLLGNYKKDLDDINAKINHIDVKICGIEKKIDNLLYVVTDLKIIKNDSNHNLVSNTNVNTNDNVNTNNNNHFLNIQNIPSINSDKLSHNNMIKNNTHLTEFQEKINNTEIKNNIEENNENTSVSVFSLSTGNKINDTKNNNMTIKNNNDNIINGDNMIINDSNRSNSNNDEKKESM